MTDTLAVSMAQLVSVIGAVWGFTELLGRGTGWPKLWISLASGPAFTTAAFWLGWVTGIPGTGIKSYLAAGFLGFIATMLSKAFHDLIGDRLLAAIPGLKKPDGG